MYKRVLTEAQLEGSGKNAIAKFLADRLVVPKIFLDARWPSRTSRVDVLAVDRAGAGDIHVVGVKVGTDNLVEAVIQILKVPAHFRYVAFIDNKNYRVDPQVLYAPDSIGRVGIIQLTERGTELDAEVEVSPERFRIAPEVLKQIDRFTAKERAHIEVRV